MFGHQTRILDGLLLKLMILGCTPIKVNIDSAQPDDNRVITDDRSADQPDQDITESPPATLTIDSLRQTASMTAYCWQCGDRMSLCGDGFGITTLTDPISAGSTFRAEFEFLIAASPENVGLSVFPAY